MILPPAHRLALLLALALALAQPALCQSDRLCYYPSGQQSTDVPCNATTGGSSHTFCCATGYICFSNRLCVPDPTNANVSGAPDYNRGSCTDPTWESSDCPQFCLATSSDRRGGAAVTNCGTGAYCCTNEVSSTDADETCCSNSTGILSLGTGNIETTIGVLAATATGGGSSGTSSSSTTTASARSSSTASSNAASTTAAAGASATAAASDDDSSSGLSSGARIGVGVGVGAAVLLAAIVGVWLVRRSKGQQQQQQQKHQPVSQVDPHAELDGARTLQEMPTKNDVAPAELDGTARAK